MTGSKIKQHIRHLLHVDETPHELAKAFAAGVFVAFTPFLGLHTAIILVVAWAFRLNKLAALTGTFVNNPWTIAFVYIGPTWLMVSVMRYLGSDIHPMNYELISTHFLKAYRAAYRMADGLLEGLCQRVQALRVRIHLRHHGRRRGYRGSRIRFCLFRD